MSALAGAGKSSGLESAGLAEPVIELKGIVKHFGAVRALTNASLMIRRGESHALLGVNGAGKSTLVKVLTGDLRADRGEIYWKQKPVRISSPAQARRLGIAAVFQEPTLAPDLSLVENFRLIGINTPEQESLLRRALSSLGLGSIAWSTYADELPLPILRVIDLARALSFLPELLVLDELTAELPPDLSEKVFNIIRSYVGAGGSIVYVSHRLGEVRQLCTKATVLRNGQTVAGSVLLRELSDHELFELMVGSAMASEAASSPAPPRSEVAQVERRVALEVRGLNLAGKLHDVAFSLFEGEILGVAALQGQGAEELFEVLAGARRPDSGEIKVQGRLLKPGSVRSAIDAGVVFVPAQRARALLPVRSVLENVGLPLDSVLRRWFRAPSKESYVRAQAAISRLAIDTRGGQQVRRLSGGNRQKVVVARWLARGFRVLLAFDPTRGIDVATRAEIYNLLRDLAGSGVSVLIYSSEFAELVSLCERVIVLYQGAVHANLAGAEVNENHLALACHGLSAATESGGAGEDGSI